MLPFPSPFSNLLTPDATLQGQMAERRARSRRLLHSRASTIRRLAGRNIRDGAAESLAGCSHQHLE